MEHNSLHSIAKTLFDAMEVSCWKQLSVDQIELHTQKLISQLATKEEMAGKSGEVFSLDFLFIEQAREPEPPKGTSHESRSIARRPGDARC